MTPHVYPRQCAFKSIEDIKDNKIPDLVLAYYVATSFFYKSDVHELAYTTKATAYS